MRVNRNLKTSAEKERRANAAKTDFLSRMSHDIRTPLNAVIGFSELASGEEDLSEETEDYLKKINSSGKYLLGLINDILDMSKIESKKIELHETLVYGPDFLQDIADMFTAQAKKKGITLKTDFSESQTPWVYMDALRSRQIYSNLLNNAIKFSEEGSTVTWKITDRILAENQMEMICVIADEGCGMSKEFMKHIFKPFEQEHNSHSDAEGGTGLGLSIVKSLVETMGGTISVESELGKGSTFTIKMSRRIGDGSEQEREGKQKTQDLTRLSGKRVLLCEDHPLNQEIALRLLKRQNVKAEVAENGKIGVDMFTAAKPGYFDMILMDIRMPVMDGLEATKAIRTSGKEGASSIPIIAMTANAFEDDIQSCIQAGMNAHVAKPINPDKLFHTMAQYFLE
jgi:CheY-like chemotaxis protein